MFTDRELPWQNVTFTLSELFEWWSVVSARFGHAEDAVVFRDFTKPGRRQTF